MFNLRNDMPLYRNEFKYICTNNEIVTLSNKISHVLPHDKHSGVNGYLISSMYFDDIYDTCCKENDSGISSRYKYRVRIYNNDPSFIKLEKKIKFNEKCHKKSCRISEKELNMLVSGTPGKLTYDVSRPVLREFCTLMLTRLFVPKAVVRYHRKAYTAPAGNVRITFDTNIAVSDDFNGFLSGEGSYIPIQQQGFHVAEVKYDEFIPDYILNALQMNILYKSTFSKYYFGRQVLSDQERNF